MSLDTRQVAEWSSKGGKFRLVLTHGRYGYDYNMFDRQWAVPRSSGSVPGDSDSAAIAEIERQLAIGWHGNGLTRKG